MASNREKKRIVHEGVNRLLNTPEWNPYTFRQKSPDTDKPESAALNAIRENNAATVYDSSADCPACMKVRAETGDLTALCHLHISEAMGLA
jgi:hypothetical protein